MKFFGKKTPFPLVNTNRIIRKPKRQIITIIISKRQKFIIAVLTLTFVLYLLGNLHLERFALQIALSLAALTDIFLFWSVFKDIKDNFTGSIFILPFIYSFSFGLFYFLLPEGITFRVLAAFLYAFGLYSLYLSQNVFVVASIRTIALLSGARIVSFVITLLSYFFLANITYSFHTHIVPTIILLTVFTFLLIYQSIKTYALQKIDYPSVGQWSSGLTMCLAESALFLWFWPSSPTIIALFLTGYFYTLTGLSHVWFEKRLFKSILWEFVWVGAVVFLVLMAFTSWGK